MKKKNYFIIILFIILSIVTFISPMVADDYGYINVLGEGRRISSLWDIFISQANQYRLMNGRVLAHFFAQLFLWMPRIVFSVVNAGIIIAYLLKITEISKKNTLLDFVIVGLMFLFFMPAIGNTIFWLTGSTNYLWTTTFILFYLHILYLWLFEDKDVHKWYVILGFFAGACNENTSASIIAITLFSLVIKWFLTKKINRVILITFLASVSSFIFMILAPGNANRLAYVSNGQKATLTTYINRIFDVTKVALFTEHLWVLIFIIIGLFIYYLYKKDFNRVLRGFFFFVIALMANYAMIIPGVYPDRAMFGFVSLLLITFYVLLPVFHAKQGVIIALLLAICTAQILYQGAFELAYVSYHCYLRDKRIQQQKQKGILVFDDEEFIGGIYKLNPKANMADLSRDSNHWFNRGFAHYHGIESIKSNNSPIYGHE